MQLFRHVLFIVLVRVQLLFGLAQPDDERLVQFVILTPDVANMCQCRNSLSNRFLAGINQTSYLFEVLRIRDLYHCIQMRFNPRAILAVTLVEVSFERF
jgi:hypothetical protein